MIKDTLSNKSQIGKCELVVGESRWEVAAEYRDVLLGPDGLRLDEWLERGQARVVKHGPHRTVYRVVLPEVDCYVKHCRVHDGRAWLRECVRPAKARGEYQRCLAVAARGVPTVTPLAVGEARGPRPGDSFLVTKALDAEPLGTFIEQALPALEPGRQARLRQRLTVALARFLARLHGAGVTHDDLHPNNLLLTFGADDEPRLHLIDLHAVRLGAPLGRRARRDNLVVINRWFVMRVSRADRLRFWKEYESEVRRQKTEDRIDGLLSSVFCLLSSDAAARDLEARTWRSNLRFWKARDRRCLERNRYYRPVRSADAAGHAVADLDHAALDALAADPDAPFRSPGVVLLKDSPSSTVAEFDLSLPDGPRRVIWKRFRITSAADPLTALLRRTAALRSWVHGHGLRERCLPTPRPLLVLHRRWHALKWEGYLLTEKVADAEELSRHVAGLRTIPDGERRRRLRSLVERVARLIRELHRRELAHRDLKAANVLVQRTTSGLALWLIDLVGVTRHRALSRWRRLQNLTRLHVSFHQHPLLTRTDKLRFLRTYLMWGLHGKQGWKEWWRAIAVATRDKVEKNARNRRILS
jgi:tRNA A-37 threonylcarbamoyl transferase component Bud32